MDDSGKPVIAVLEPGYASYDTEREVLAELDAAIIPVPVDADAVTSLRDSSPSVLMTRERIIDSEMMDAFPDLKVIVRYGVGVDNIDLESARSHKIYVANIPDYGAEQEVSDHAISLYLAVSRRIVTRDRQVKNGVWGVGQDEIIYGHKGKVLGLIGFGHIGHQAFKKFKALGFGRTLVMDPALTKEEASKLGVEICDLMRICRESDAISLHAKLTPETHHIINRTCLGAMKPSTVLVNVGRGELIDERALIDELSAGGLFGAGLDVLEQEPPNPDNPLFSMSNVVLTDHTAWYSEDTVRALQHKGASEVLRVLQGKEPINWANRW